MSVLVWMFLALLGSLLAWEGIARLRRRRAGRSGDRPADHYMSEAEVRRGLDATASSAEHASAVGLRARIGPRR